MCAYFTMIQQYMDENILILHIYYKYIYDIIYIYMFLNTYSMYMYIVNAARLKKIKLKKK